MRRNAGLRGGWTNVEQAAPFRPGKTRSEAWRERSKSVDHRHKSIEIDRIQSMIDSFQSINNRIGKAIDTIRSISIELCRCTIEFGT
jgi:hypothetical protein